MAEFGLRAWSISKEKRERRADDMETIIQRYGARLFGLEGGGIESGILFLEAVRCYEVGSDAGALVCAHATCERELAALLRWQQPATVNSARWGLGRLISAGAARGWFDGDLRELLERTNVNRRDLYHLQADWMATDLWRRAVSTAERPTKEDALAAFHVALQVAAREAVEAAFRVRTIEVEQCWK